MLCELTVLYLNRLTFNVIMHRAGVKVSIRDLYINRQARLVLGH
jgi:hypothetical protein